MMPARRQAAVFAALGVALVAVLTVVSVLVFWRGTPLAI